VRPIGGTGIGSVTVVLTDTVANWVSVWPEPQVVVHPTAAALPLL
jgi:hypothetical protein